MARREAGAATEAVATAAMEVVETAAAAWGAAAVAAAVAAAAAPRGPVCESGRRNQGVSSGRRLGRPPGSGTGSCMKYEPVRTEPLGDGRERRYIAAWFPPGDDQHGRPVSACEMEQLTAEQLTMCRQESYVVRLLGGLDEDARRRAAASNQNRMSAAARRLYRPVVAAGATSQKNKNNAKRARERRAELKVKDPEAARLAREADAERMRKSRGRMVG